MWNHVSEDAAVLGYWKYVGQIKHFSGGVLIWLVTDGGFSILRSY